MAMQKTAAADLARCGLERQRAAGKAGEVETGRIRLAGAGFVQRRCGWSSGAASVPCGRKTERERIQRKRESREGEGSKGLAWVLVLGAGGGVVAERFPAFVAELGGTHPWQLEVVGRG